MDRRRRNDLYRLDVYHGALNVISVRRVSWAVFRGP